MWEIYSHKLEALTELTYSKVKFIWPKIKEYSFDGIKRIVACDTLLAYLGFNEEFKIQTDDRKF